MIENSGIRFLVNFRNYVLILCTTALIAGAVSDDKPPPDLLEFLFSYLFTLPVICWGAIAVPMLIGLDWLAARQFRSAHRLILVMASALLLGLPAQLLTGESQFALGLALGGALYGLAFRSILPARDGAMNVPNH